MQRYTLYVEEGSHRLYLMPYALDQGQRPGDIDQQQKAKWENAGLLSPSCRVMALDDRLHHLHSELESAVGGDWFELDEQFQFVGGPSLVRKVV